MSEETNVSPVHCVKAHDVLVRASTPKLYLCMSFNPLHLGHVSSSDKAYLYLISPTSSIDQTKKTPTHVIFPLAKG